MSKNFDGPSFINPEHTSFGNRLKSIYQTPNLVDDSSYKNSAFSKHIKKAEDNNKNNSKRKPLGGKEFTNY